MKMQYIILIIVIIIFAGGVLMLMGNGQEKENSGINAESFGFDATADEDSEIKESSSSDATNNSETSTNESIASVSKSASLSSREIQTTDGVKHSIPLDEILGGGPGKDGIPSIDDPKFEGVRASSLNDDDIGIGITHNGEARFYPFQILVWHEIVNDTLGGSPLLVTYCPLCQTGIVFDRRVNGDVQEFGVSGNLWRSNLLMYNRTAREEDESLWSQALGEAVVGPSTGVKLSVVSSDIVKWGDWSSKNPGTLVLKRPSGVLRPYGTDPYGSYYTNNDVGFGAGSADTRGIHPKTFTHGIEINGAYKAYVTDKLPVGNTKDTFGGESITVTKSDIGEVRFSSAGKEVPTTSGFWFSWVAIHPETEIWESN
jgi:hypothetical protein